MKYEFYPTLAKPVILSLLPQQIAAETFENIRSTVLQGSKVVLDVEEGGPGKRSITSLDSATSITTNMTCFMSSDGKEDCYINALPGECDFVNSFASDGRRHLKYIPGQSPTGNGMRPTKPTSNMKP